MAEADNPNPQAAAPDWLPELLVAPWDFFATYPPVLALIVLVVGLALAIIGRSLVLRWGGKLTSGVDHGLDTRLLRVVAGVAALVVAYVSAVLAIQIVGFSERVERILINVLLSLLILRLIKSAMTASHLGLEILSRIRDRYEIVEERTIPLFELVSTIIIIAAAAYALLMVWEINPTAWLASAGVIGIAVGIAARDTLANLFAGFFIIAESPYKLGDYIVLDNGQRGEVTRVGIRSTRLLTRDDVEITVPNAEMANAKIINESGGRWVKFRIRIQVGVAYGSDVDQVVELLESVAFQHDTVCQDPAPRVRMRGFGDSSLNFELLCWVNHPSERGLVTHELFMKIYKELGKAGIEIPFPQRDVWMRSPERAAMEDGREDGTETAR